MPMMRDKRERAMIARPIVLLTATAVLAFMTTADSGSANPLAANTFDTLALDMSAQQRGEIAPGGRPGPRVMQSAPPATQGPARVMQSAPRVIQSVPRGVAYPARVVSQPGYVRVISPPGSVSVNPSFGGSGARIVAPGPQAAPRF